MSQPTRCPRCLRYRGDLTCDAFPSGIPEAISTGMFDHVQSHRGDHGVRFQKVPKGYGGKVQKAEGFDPTQAIAQHDDIAYRRVKQVLMNIGYLESDFDEGGPFYGWSTNELIDFARDKRTT